MARHAPPARLLAAAVHELAQPCASAMLAVDTALELASRHRAFDVVSRLESAAGELAQLQKRLRLFSLVATSGATNMETVDVAALVRAVIPGAVVESCRDAYVHSDIARAVVEDIAVAIGAVPEATRVLRSDHGDTIEIRLVGAADTAGRLDLWCPLLALAGVAVSFRREAGSTLAFIRMRASKVRNQTRCLAFGAGSA